MKLLLDTHALLWWLDDDPRLTAGARSVIADPGNDVFYSAASTWEMAIKIAAGRLEVRGDLPSAIASSGFGALPISVEHAVAAGALPPHHHDPFDRMLVAQARLEGLTIVTRDPNIPGYEVQTLGA